MRYFYSVSKKVNKQEAFLAILFAIKMSHRMNLNFTKLPKNSDSNPSLFARTLPPLFDKNLD